MTSETTSETIQTAPAHHRYSPSKLKLLSLCPGYEGDDEPSLAAEEGTRLHLAAETGDMTGLDDEQRALVATCLEYVDTVTADCATVLREQHLKVLGGGEKGTEGTADVVAVNGAHAHIIDYKFGRVAVPPAEENLQGFAYALGAFDEFDAESVTVHFLLPRRDEVSRAVFSRAEYKRLALAVAEVLNGCRLFATLGRPASMLAPSPTACRWCAARGRCEALSTPCVALAERSNGGLVMPTETNPALMSTDQLTQALGVEGILIAWAERFSKACKTEAIQRLKAGSPVPGYAIKRKSGAREIDDAVAASAILADKFGFDAGDIARCTRLKLGDVEKVAAEKAGRGKGAAAKERLNEALDPLITRKADYEYITALE